jgi:hypothetical protein
MGSSFNGAKFQRNIDKVIMDFCRRIVMIAGVIESESVQQSLNRPRDWFALMRVLFATVD